MDDSVAVDYDFNNQAVEIKGDYVSGTDDVLIVAKYDIDGSLISTT